MIVSLCRPAGELRCNRETGMKIRVFSAMAALGVAFLAAACGDTVGERAATGALGGAVIAGPPGAIVGGTVGAVTN